MPVRPSLIPLAAALSGLFAAFLLPGVPADAAAPLRAHAATSAAPTPS